MSIDNYDILNILGNNIYSTTYKVKDKRTEEVLVWWTVDYHDKSTVEKQYFLDKIQKRSTVCHPNILKFYNYIDQEQNKILYILTEYCRNGSLKDIINSCLTNNTQLSEELICKILYQTAFAMKTIGHYSDRLNTTEVFLDEDFNVKLFNFQLDYTNKTLRELKTCYLGVALYEISTFKIFKEKNYIDELKYVENLYSQSMLSLIKCLIKDNTDIRKNIDKILCHPTVLLKSAQWSKDKNFINIENSDKCIPPIKDSINGSQKCSMTEKLEKLRKKENALQIREQKLNEREYKLVMRERKITFMERTVKEKLQQAELYLKRCRETKSSSSESSKSTLLQKQNKKSYEDLDSTYVSCGDSVLMPTSFKLNVNKIVKPAPFTRTLSERRIRFKGHSPLKEVDFNRRSTKLSKSQKGTILKKKCEWLTCSEDTDKSSTDGRSKGMRNKAKQLFLSKNTYENDTNNDMLCKPIEWTEENKRHAFDLLRMMKFDKENQIPEIKHTYL